MQSDLVDSLKNVIANGENAAERTLALVFYYSIVRRDKRNEIGERQTVVSFLDGRLAAESNAIFRSQAFIFRLDALLRQDRMQEIRAQVAALPAWLSSGAKQAAYTYGIFAEVGLGDFASARNLLLTYERAFPGASEHIFLTDYITAAEDAYSRNAQVTENLVARKFEIQNEEPSGNRIPEFNVSPNPFNPQTKILLFLRDAAPVRIEIYNILGQKVAIIANARLAAGEHSFIWDASGLPSGVYFAHWQAGGVQGRKKLSLLR